MTDQRSGPTTAPAATDDDDRLGPTGTARRGRDAAATRSRLLEAALHRFTVDGYSATTVRDIADDAGANVALISRYFTSKEGLFVACLDQAAALLEAAGNAVAAPPSPADEDATRLVAEAIARAIGVGASTGVPRPLLLLLQSSGDPSAEERRLGVLSRFATQLAEAAGAGDRSPTRATLHLRAQVLLATAVGVAVLRAAGGPQPLASATPAALVEPIEDVVRALLG